MEQGAIVIVSSLVAYIVSQFLKNLYFLGNREFSIKRIFDSGGLPSSHSATVAALVTSLYILTGLSTETAVSFVLFLVVFADAMGIRRRAGIIAATVNRFHRTKLPENLGHNIAEVVLGAAIGVAMSIIIVILTK